MFKLNSIFFRVLAPVIFVMLLQVLLISMVLFVNGTIGSLENNAVDALRKNVENRGMTLENVMIRTWAGLDALEIDVADTISEYLESHDLTMEQVLGNAEHEQGILYGISDAMLDMLRSNSSTGVYLYFLDNAEYSERKLICNGLYYYDPDPISTLPDYSDVLFLRGPVNIARKNRIQLDSLWNESFTFSPENPGEWESLVKPWQAALAYPELTSADLSYWSSPHLLEPDSPIDAKERITYTRPLFWDGQLIGMVGIELQVEQVKKSFPASDFDSSEKSGYMIVKYDNSKTSESIDCGVYAITGSYIKRLIGTIGQVSFVTGYKEGVYTFADASIEEAQIALQPLRLYNVNAPFSNEQWALASIGADSSLFATARSVNKGILYSASVGLVFGILLLFITVRVTTKPLISIANQIEKSDPGDTIVISSSNTYETALLCSTINTMTEKRRHIEAELREERERYLVALESTADTFMEYDIERDNFMLYYFSPERRETRLSSVITDSFITKIRNGEVCHPDDAQSMVRLLTAQTVEPIEIRIRTEHCVHLADAVRDGEYFWFLLKASHIRDDKGNAVKIIGVAREITQEKLAELERAEAARRDQTTGLYNREYGENLVKKLVESASEAQQPFAICLLRFEDFELFEAHYGRVFGGALMMKLSWELAALLDSGDIAVRMGNDEVLVFLDGAGEDEAGRKIDAFCNRLAALYTGENTDLRLNVGAGVALSTDAGDYRSLADKAYRAAQYADRAGTGRMMSFHALPPQAKGDKTPHREKPVSVSLDASKEGIVSFVFDLFEQSSDIQSAINILLAILGKVFALDQIIICAYDAVFCANQITHQWNVGGSLPQAAGGIEKVSQDDLDELESLLDENGVVLYDTDCARSFGDGVRRLLCVAPDEEVSALGCMTYENGAHTGRILFKSAVMNRTWSETELFSLYEITKVISAHISIDKSNSASRAKSEFLSRMSHEIRTPMNAIIGMTWIAKESVRDPERVEECLEKIDFSAKHLLSLINDVLEMSRIESGKLQVQNEPFSMAGFATSLDILMRSQFESKGITFEIVNNARVHVVSDEYRLRQVLVNLLGNAWKFTGAGGRVTLSIEQQGAPVDGVGSFRFSVKDTGIGIAKDDQLNIFQAFEQAKGEVKSRETHDGTGLGLAISSNIIGALGGKIELESDVGVGSEFYFVLKMKLDAGHAAAESPTETEEVVKDSLAGQTVLLVEDMDINLEIATYILGEFGLQVETAKNGREAVEQFCASPVGHFDAILMDIQMPVMDGLTATREIRKTDRADARTVPIIAMTANAFDEDMKKSIESGMNGHIAKPIDNGKLYALLAQLIKNPRKN